MRITIEAETDKEKEQIGEKKIIENIFEFALIGRRIKQKLFEDTFSYLHIADKYVLFGKISELRERLRDGC